MSTDLEFRQELLEMRLPALNIKISQSSDIQDDSSGGIIQSQESTTRNINEEEEEEKCRTPKFPQNMIPKILSCPPAPKKPRRVASSSSCKRNLSEFFEFLAREEIESFFRQFDVSNSSTGGLTVIKKRCLA